MVLSVGDPGQPGLPGLPGTYTVQIPHKLQKRDIGKIKSCTKEKLVQELQ